MSELFDMVLSQSGLRFSELLDDAGKDEIRSFWDNIVRDRGTVTDAEIDSVLSTYKDLGVIVPADGTTNDQEKQLNELSHRWKEVMADDEKRNSPLARFLNGGYERPTVEDSKGSEQAAQDFINALHAQGDPCDPSVLPDENGGTNTSAATAVQSGQSGNAGITSAATGNTSPVAGGSTGISSGIAPTNAAKDDPTPEQIAAALGAESAGTDAASGNLAQAGKHALESVTDGKPHPSPIAERTAAAAVKAGYVAPKTEDAATEDPDISNDIGDAFRQSERSGLKQTASDAMHEVAKSAVKATKKLADKVQEAVQTDASTATIPSSGKKRQPGYEVIYQDSHEADKTHPIMILADPHHVMLHHQVGAFTDPTRRTAFEFVFSGKAASSQILQIDRRFIKLLKWLGQGHIAVKLSGYPLDSDAAETAHDMKGTALKAGYAVYKIRAVDINSNEILQTANNDFLQLVIRRMLASVPKEELTEEAEDEEDQSDTSMLLTDMPAMIDYVNCAEDSLPDNIRNWCHRQIAMVQSNSVSQEEQRHARHALSLMLNIQWQGNYFPSVDPVEARRILNEELYGMQEVKQRIIETIIQINRTHTLPSYGLLLVGPAGTGKSQIAYAVARILKLPWCSLDMSAIHDTEALTGSPRVYSNAKPGKIMEAFSQAGSSNLVFIINELDKAGIHTQSGNPADALLTLLDNLGFTDNYMECTIPTGGVYPIATANDRDQISEPLLTRFAEIKISDYTTDEKKIIFRDYSLPKILKRMGMSSGELQLTGDAITAVVERYEGLPGVRDLEQAAEHLAAHALFELETTRKGQPQIRYNADDINRILG